MALGDLGLLQQLAQRVCSRLAGEVPGLSVHAGTDYAGSDDPRVRMLLESGGHLDWVALAFAPFSLWDLHVGLVLVQDHVSVGVHASSRRWPEPPPPLARAALAVGAQYTHAATAREHQFNLPPRRFTKTMVAALERRTFSLCRLTAATLPSLVDAPESTGRRATPRDTGGEER